jgi:hypothetical protein
MSLAKKKFAVLQETIMPLRFLVIHLVVAMASKKTVVLQLNTEMKVTEASAEAKLSVK